MPPAWVLNLEDYVRWVEQLLASTGGDASLEWELVPYEEDDSHFVTLFIRPTIVRFPWAGTALTFDMVVGDDLIARKYRFHFAPVPPSSQLIWRKDKHQGHEELGGRSHIHKPHSAGEAIEAFDEVDLDEVIQQIADYHARERPGGIIARLRGRRIFRRRRHPR